MSNSYSSPYNYSYNYNYNYNDFIHRSSSTYSFTHHHANHSVPDPTPIPFFSPSSSSSPTSNTSSDFLDFHSQPVRRVFSTGDLQGTPLTENCGQEGVQIGGRVERYTAEERMKRIERYRSKRNQRNFQKKITYACRKTLADSRPRVRGRFARNYQTEASDNSYGSYNHNSNRENCGNYNSCDNGVSNNDDWWWQLESALGPTDEEEECLYVEDTWASFDSVFSMNLLS